MNCLFALCNLIMNYNHLTMALCNLNIDLFVSEVI